MQINIENIGQVNSLAQALNVPPAYYSTLGKLKHIIRACAPKHDEIEVLISVELIPNAYLLNTGLVKQTLNRAPVCGYKWVSVQIVESVLHIKCSNIQNVETNFMQYVLRKLCTRGRCKISKKKIPRSYISRPSALTRAMVARTNRAISYTELPHHVVWAVQ